VSEAVQNYVEIHTEADTFPWSPKNVNGDPLPCEFELRILPDEQEKKFRRANTKTGFEQHQRVTNFDVHGFLGDCLEYCVVSMKGVRAKGGIADLERTKKNLLLLPEAWKSEINRLCVGKEATLDAEKKS
jgi:hypothetical protein